MAKKKKAGVVFLYPCFPIIGFLPTDRSWTLFHRMLPTEMEHDPVNELCWCSPICIESTSLVGKNALTQLEYERITKCSLH